MTEHLTIEQYRNLVRAGATIARESLSAARRPCPACERHLALLRLLEHLLRPGWQVQLEHRFHPTRRWRFDLALPEVGLAVEIDGGGWVHGRHHREQGRRDDEEKRQAAESLGWRVLRVGWEHVKSGEALDLIQRIAVERGPRRVRSVTTEGA